MQHISPCPNISPNHPRVPKHTSKLLRLTPSIIRHQQCPIILHEGLLQLVLRILIHVFLIVGDDGFGNGLADSVDLGGVTTAGDADADVDVGKFVEADYEEGFVDLRWSKC